MPIASSHFCKAAGWIIAGAILVAAPAFAQETMRVRGLIEQVQGDVVTIKSREGTEVKVRVPANATITAIVKATMADIKPGSYIGVGGMPQPDGTQKAISVHIFHESMRGLAEGHRPWDLRPQATMTNATVETTVASVDGQSIMLKHKDGETKVAIPAELQIVSYVPGDASDLKAGAGVFIGAATRQPDGTLSAQRLTVGREVQPPM